MALVSWEPNISRRMHPAANHRVRSSLTIARRVHLIVPRSGFYFMHLNHTENIMFTIKQLNSKIKSINGRAASLRGDIQEVLIAASYHAMKDGQITPFNQLLDAVGNGTYIKGITLWAETFAPVRIKDGVFVYNKTAAKEYHVTNEADFADFEADMRKINWWDIAGKQKTQSMFDLDDYASNVEKKLSKEGYIGLAEAVKKLIDEYHAAQKAEISELIKGE